MENEQLGVVNRLIVAQSETAETVRQLSDELRQDRIAIGGLAHEVQGLASEMREERRVREAANAEQDKEIARIERIATAASRRVVVRWLPAAGAIGAGVAWALKEGPAIWLSWQLMFP